MRKWEIVVVISLVSLSLVSCQEFRTMFDIFNRQPRKKCLYRELENGITIPQATTYRSGFTVLYACRAGYELNVNIVSAFATCYNGVWNRALPRCVVIPFPTTTTPPMSSTMNQENQQPECDPLTLENGVVKPPNPPYMAGKAASFHCNDGYERNGTAITMCLHNATWAIPPPTCEAKEKKPEFCIGRLLKNGKSDPDKSVYKGREAVLYKCDVGYVLQGDAVAACFVGKWTAKLPFCEKKKQKVCKPPLFPRGTIYPRKSTYGNSEVIRYTCVTGYSLIGERTAECFEGKWSSEYPRCEEKKQKTCKPPPFSHGTIYPRKSTFGNLDVIRYTCKSGYSLKGESTAACYKGKWTSKYPRCEDKKKMCKPRPFTHGTINPLKTIYGNLEVVRYNCETGYSLKGKRTAACLKGKWTSESPRCEASRPFPETAMNCEPPSMEHGSYTPRREQYGVGSTITIVCKIGYFRVGARKATCRENGEWSKLGICENLIITTREHGCEAPSYDFATYSPRLPRGKDVYSVGDRITFTCARKAFTLGHNFAECQSSGKWSRTPSCPNGCKEPLIVNGYYNTRALKVDQYFSQGSVIIIGCNPGYVLDGDRSVRCGTNNKWGSRLPICKRLAIRPPTTAEHGCEPPSYDFVAYSPLLPRGKDVYSVGDRITFTCKGGTFAVGHSFAKCQPNGKWSTKPFCPKKCRRPVIANGRIDKSGAAFTHNRVIRVICDVGYLAVGKKSATCRYNGAWSAKPRCTDGCYQPKITGMKVYPVPYGGGKVFEFGKRVTFRCDAGFSASVTIATCRGKNRWDKTLPSCKRISDVSARSGCRKPELTEGLIMKNHLQAVYPYKTQFEFQCATGFNMVGSAISICRKHLYGPLGGLDPHPPRCQRVKCGSPGKPDNGRVRYGDKGSYYFEDTVYFECDDRYIMSGNDHIKCQASGQFSGLPPKCQPPSCRVECVYVYGRECQCDAKCRNRGDCCGDFEQHCRRLFY